MTFQRAFLSKFCVFVFSALFLLNAHSKRIVAQELPQNSDPGRNSVFLLPEKIIDSFFPSGKEYQIPADRKISGILERAENFEKRGNPSQASKYYSLAYKRVEDENKAPYILFKQCYLMESIERSIEGLEELIEKYPSFPLRDAVRYELAAQLYLKGEYDSASAVLDELIESESDAAQIFTPYAYTFKGIISFDSESHDKAIEYHKIANKSFVGEHQDNRGAFFIRNYVEISQNLTALGKYKEAEALLIRIIGSSALPVLGEQALFLLAQGYALSGKTDLAYIAYSQLIERFPSSIYRLNAEKQREELAVEQKPQGTVEIKGIYDESILLGKYGEGPVIQPQPAGSEHGSVLDKASGRFVVQVGAFSRESNAKSLVDLLMKQGFPAFTLKAVVSDKLLFRVRVGYYSTVQEAERVRQAIVEKGYEGYVVEVK